MSLNQLLLDEKKPYLDIRVNDITVDGSATIETISATNATITNDLNVGNDASIGNDLNVTNDLAVLGNGDFASITVADAVVTNSLQVNSSASPSFRVTDVAGVTDYVVADESNFVCGQGLYSNAVGNQFCFRGTTNAGEAIAIGLDSQARGINGMAIGRGAIAGVNATDSFALGKDTEVANSQTNAFAIGSNCIQNVSNGAIIAPNGGGIINPSNRILIKGQGGLLLIANIGNLTPDEDSANTNGNTIFKNDSYIGLTNGTSANLYTFVMRNSCIIHAKIDVLAVEPTTEKNEITSHYVVFRKDSGGTVTAASNNILPPIGATTSITNALGFTFINGGNPVLRISNPAGNASIDISFRIQYTLYQYA